MIFVSRHQQRMTVLNEELFPLPLPGISGSKEEAKGVSFIACHASSFMLPTPCFLSLVWKDDLMDRWASSRAERQERVSSVSHSIGKCLTNIVHGLAEMVVLNARRRGWKIREETDPCVGGEWQSNLSLSFLTASSDVRVYHLDTQVASIRQQQMMSGSLVVIL